MYLKHVDILIYSGLGRWGNSWVHKREHKETYLVDLLLSVPECENLQFAQQFGQIIKDFQTFIKFRYSEKAKKIWLIFHSLFDIV